LLCFSAGYALAQGGLTAAAAKQILNQKLMQLKPDSARERNVLFQDLRIIASGGGSYHVAVTALVRDYDAGYPRNRYYGRTCVGRFENEQFTLMPASTGGWLVNGRLTPDLAKTKCQPNPADGVSSIPLASLPGSPAPAGNIAQAPAMARSGGVAVGSYECWNFNQAAMMLNFTIQPGGRYLDSGGRPGTFTFTPGTQRIQFVGGSLNGGAGYFPIYYEPQGLPTVSFRNAKGDEVVFCQRK
jgi:hypothetical protein